MSEKERERKSERESVCLATLSITYFVLIAHLDRVPCGDKSEEWVCLITIGQLVCVCVCCVCVCVCMEGGREVDRMLFLQYVR